MCMYTYIYICIDADVIYTYINIYICRYCTHKYIYIQSI